MLYNFCKINNLKVWDLDKQGRCLMRNSEKLVNLKLVALVGTCFLLQLSHDGMLGVNLHGLLRDHVRRHGVVTQNLRLHDSFHVGGPAVHRCRQNTRGICQPGADNFLLSLVIKYLLHEFGERHMSFLHFDRKTYI